MGDQSYSTIASLRDGGFVVTWSSMNQDTSSWGIYGQKFTSSCDKDGAEFRVNTRVLDQQVSSSISALKNGGFVVAWQSWNQDGADWGVYAQRFAVNGNKDGTEFQVNTYNSSSQADPSIATLNDGSFIITWHSYGQDGSDWGIYAQKSASGSRDGAEFRVNTYTASSQVHPSAAALEDGGFVITWHSYGQDGSDWGIYAQKFSASCNKIDLEFLVNSYTPGEQAWSSVAPLYGGGFVIMYDSGSHDAIYMKLYNKDMQEVCIGADKFADGFAVAADKDGNNISCIANTSQSSSSGFGVKCDLSNSSSYKSTVQVANADNCYRPFVVDYGGKWLVSWDSILNGTRRHRQVNFDSP